MINVNVNLMNTKNKKEYNSEKRESFKIDKDNLYYLKKFVIQKKSIFFNKAIRAYINLLINPKQIMIELKIRHPKLWKQINRRKF